MNPKIIKPYAVVCACLALFAVVLIVLMRDTTLRDAVPVATTALIKPILALVGLTGVVLILMVIFRNIAFIQGVATERYFKVYAVDHPPEWVERPGRAYMNLLEVPTLFYLLCVMMLITAQTDQTQVALAWLFVWVRVVHAFIHLVLNYIPLRFAAYMAGCITLTVMWVRFAGHYL